MIILGVNFSHDSSVCIIQDGRIIAAIEEEKVSRIKQDLGWPRLAIERLFFEHGIKKDDINVVAVDRMVFDELSNSEIKYRFSKSKLIKFQENVTRCLKYFLNQERKPIFQSGKKCFHDELIKNGFKNFELVTFDHHLSHAASVFYSSPVPINLVVTSDGMGGDSSFNFYSTEKEELNCIRKNDYKISVGGFYSMITMLLGFRPGRHEGKITGLAAYGTDTSLVDQFTNFWKYSGNTLTRYPFDKLDDEWMDLRIDKRLSLKDKINIKSSSGKITSDYSSRNIVLYELLKNITKGFSKEDIAYACQKVAEKITINEIKKVISDNQLQRISVGLAGGVFANVRINQLILEIDEVENVYVQPAMGDSGLALGNAILANNEKTGKDPSKRHFVFNNTSLGPNYSQDLSDFIINYRSSEIEFKKMDNPSKEVADLLYENKIIGLWTGSMEWGPRALGNRSIILNTFDKSVNESLNERLNRTEFMPFAPVVLDTHAEEYYPKYHPKIPAANYMTITYDTDPKYHELLQATVHVDGTARPQVLQKEFNPYYYDILKEFSKISGCGALVNTSFNAHEEPILSSPETAIDALLSQRVDCLVMEDYLFYLK